ncbi:hypothetical protein [Levilactobacillus brevis]|nr:hypothetical protein [Levilactobacillus brevis]
MYFHAICKIISASQFFTESEKLMTHTKFFIETLAPLFIAVLVIAGLAAIVSGQLTLMVIGLTSLGAGGLFMCLLAGLLADGWYHRQSVRSLKKRESHS